MTRVRLCFALLCSLGLSATAQTSPPNIPPRTYREAVGSYDRNHEAMSLRYMDGKIASVVSIAAVVSRIRKSDALRVPTT